MYSFDMRLAELNISVSANYPYISELCSDYIIPKSDNVDIFSVSDEEKIALERTRTDEPVPSQYAETLCIYRDIAEQLPDFSRFVLHGAAISYKGKAYIFTAPSGTGKTTHISLWKRFIGDSVVIINGDKPIIKVNDGCVEVFGTPWAGKEGWQNNVSAPLAGICFVERGEVNSCSKVSASDCLVDLMKQVYIPRDPSHAIKMYELLDELVKCVPFYRLSCNISEAAVISSFEALTWEKYS